MVSSLLPLGCQTFHERLSTLCFNNNIVVLPGEDDKSANEDATNLEGIEKADYLLLSPIVAPLTIN
jgi:hypothetical protein